MESYTPAQLAKRWQVGRNKIVGWIRSGQLRAADVGETARPYYRVSQADAEEFWSRRAVKPAAPKRQRRRVTKKTNRDYFADV